MKRKTSPFLPIYDTVSLGKQSTKDGIENNSCDYRVLHIEDIFTVFNMADVFFVDRIGIIRVTRCMCQKNTGTKTTLKSDKTSHKFQVL